MNRASAFSDEQANLAVGQSKFLDDDSAEGVCPACGRKSLRTYAYRLENRVRKSTVTYIWCSSCRKMKSWFGADTEVEFSDPLTHFSKEDRKDLEHDIDSFLQYLDQLWDSGDLPQKRVSGK